MPAANFNRWAILTGTAATAAALAATTLPAEPAAERPMQAARRLGKELAAVLDELTADLGGLWKAHVHPAVISRHPIWLENMDATRDDRLDFHLGAIFSIVRDEAPGAFDIFAVRDGAGHLEGFAVVNNEAGIGALETIYRRFGGRRQGAAS